MKEKGIIIAGSIVIVLLLVAIVGVFWWQKGLVSKKTTVAGSKLTNVDQEKDNKSADLKPDWPDIEKFTEITKEDITSGNLSLKEMNLAVKEENKNLDRFFYKIKLNEKWLVIMGVKTYSKDSNYTFLHYFMGTESMARNYFKIRYETVRDDTFFDDIGVPRSYFSDELDYYRKGGRVETLIKKTEESQIVAPELARIILLGV